MVTLKRTEQRKYPGIFLNEERNRWEQRVTIDGKRMFFSAKTPVEVAAKVTEAKQRADRGLDPVTPKTTVKKFLEQWLVEVLPHTVSASTVTNYRNVVNFYIVPYIGNKQLLTLKPTDVSMMLNKLEAVGCAPNTRRAARSVLRRAIRTAEQNGHMTRNVAAIADGVRVPVAEGRTLTPAQARAFLQGVQSDRLSAAFAVMLALGLRRGETLGLAWADLELNGHRPSLTVNRSLKRLPTGLSLDQPKTKGSRRKLGLPVEVDAELKAHRKRQAEEQLAAGPEWTALPLGVDLVFRTPFGLAVDPDNFKNRTYKLTEAAGLGKWGPHELRHSAASILLAMGVPLKTVSETLGHSSIRITADVYGHLLEPARDDAAAAASKALWGWKKQMVTKFSASATGLEEDVFLTSIVTVRCKTCGGEVGWVYRLPPNRDRSAFVDVFCVNLRQDMDLAAQGMAEGWRKNGRAVPEGWDGEALRAKLMSNARINGRRLNFGLSVSAPMILSDLRMPHLPAYCGMCCAERSVKRSVVIDAALTGREVIRAS